MPVYGKLITGKEFKSYISKGRTGLFCNTWQQPRERRPVVSNFLLGGSLYPTEHELHNRKQEGRIAW